MKPPFTTEIRIAILALLLASLVFYVVLERLKTATVYAQVACGGVYHPPVKGPVIVGV